MPAISKEIRNFWSPEKRQKYENVMILLITQIEKIDSEIYQTSGKHIVRWSKKIDHMVEEMLEEKGKDI